MDINQLMAAVQQPQQGLQVVEWKQPVSGNESTFIEALNSPLIRTSTVEEVKQVLRLVMVKVGLRGQNFPTDEEKAVLLEHIITEYGNHTPMEIKLAFDMAMSFKLDLVEKEIPCYENFTCMYFSKIMNAYRKWAKDVYKQLKKEPMIAIEQKKQMSDNEWEEWIVDIRKYKMEAIPNMAYEYLERVGKIKYSTPEKKEFMASAVNHLMVKLEGRDALEFIAMKNTGKIEGKFLASLQTIAKKIAVKKYFDENPI